MLHDPTHITQAFLQIEKGLIVKKRFYFELSLQVGNGYHPPDGVIPEGKACNYFKIGTIKDQTIPISISPISYCYLPDPDSQKIE